FQGMVARIQEDTVRYLFKIRLTAQAPQRRSAVRNVTAGGDSDRPQQPYRRQGKKIERNDPCPCGSGKKYKKCCGG
ncbi:MAG TPA: hypothetical protein GX016_01630, partial [Firmicutes bacterium]|nr:hypothetical protein [Bacillota bacterium]